MNGAHSDLAIRATFSPYQYEPEEEVEKASQTSGDLASEEYAEYTICPQIDALNLLLTHHCFHVNGCIELN